MAYSFNGSSISICGSAQTKLLSCTDNDGGSKIDVTGVGDSNHMYEAGLDDKELAVEILGGDDISRGDTGATTVTWNDGGATTITNSMVIAKQKVGSLDDRVVYSITIVETPA